MLKCPTFHFRISANITQNYCSQADWIGPSVAKTLVQYGLTLVKFENKKMWTFPYHNRENVQKKYFPRSYCRISYFWREKYLVITLSHSLTVGYSSYFNFPPKTSRKVRQSCRKLYRSRWPRWSTLAYKGFAETSCGQSVIDCSTWNMPFCATIWHASSCRRLLYLEHAILCNTLT